MSPREVIRRRYFPDIVVRTHEGKAALFYEDLVKGRSVTLNFMYLGCDGTCPVTTHNLAQVQKILAPRVGRELFMYSITLDPEIDTPAALKAYARRHGAGPGWLFLRAEPRDTELLRRCLGFWDRNPGVDARRSSHAGMLRYGNEPRMLWSATSALVDPKVIARTILSIDHATS